MEVVAERFVKWESQEGTDEEENDVVEQLVKTDPKHRIAASFDSEGGDSIVSEVSEIEDLKVETSSFGEVEGFHIRNDLNHEEVPLADVGLSAQNVYFEKASGIWKCHHCTWTYKVASHVDDHIQSYKHSHLLTNVKTVDRDVTSYYKGFSNGTSGVEPKSSYISISEDGLEIQSSEVTEDSVTTTIQGGRTVTTTQHKTVKDVGTEPVYHSSQPVQASGSHAQHPSLSSAVNGNGHFHFGNQNGQEYHIKNEITGELGDLLEDDPEPIDYDVEGVLKKQETHDLICPNCNTCITRRVIFKKRKRVIKDGQRGPKRDKTEIKVDSAIRNPAEISQYTGDERPANTVDITYGQNDVITCWSCFSLLIPSGNGFKLFKIFGRKQPEVVFTPNPNQTPLLTSHKGGMSMNPGNTASAVKVDNGNTVDQKTNIPQKGGHYKLFSSYGNSRDENVPSSHQISTTQTSQVTTSSVTTNAQGTSVSNHVEGTTTTKQQTNGVENSTQTNSSSSSTKGVSSEGADYSTTHTYHSVKGQTTEAGSNIQNGSSTVSYSHDEYQIKVNDRPDSDLDSLKDRERFKSKDIVSALQGSTLLDNLVTDLEKRSTSTNIKDRDDVRISIENEVKQDVPNGTQNVSRDIVIPGTETLAHVRSPIVPTGEVRDWDVLKSIVYGGLIESITSLGVVSSAAGAETATLSVLALGLANLIAGLILIFHNLKDLKKSALEGPSNQVDRYYETLGQRNNIKLHAVVVVLSFIIFGMIPIVTYAFTFRKSDNKDYKSLAVIGASLLCIMLLSIGKAHTKNTPRTARSYFNSITYYLSIAISASGLSYVSGKLLQELVEKTGWFDTTSSVASIFPNNVVPSHHAWTSY